LTLSVKEWVVAGRVLLAVTGSIAAYKAAALASSLIADGFEVRVVLTHGGERFVTRLTFEALTGHPVVQEVWDEEPGRSRMGHLELARWADVLVVAPASAGALARVAAGSTEDMLGAVALAATCPLVIAPAMETNMWRHLATREHIAVLVERGAVTVGPHTGRLASGSSGEGRMAEPAEIVEAIKPLLARDRSLAGRRVLITAGPTYEPLDPVRFIGNRSSGKMGYALAEEAKYRGADVALVAGPTVLPDPAGVTVLHVDTGDEMRAEVLSRIGETDVLIMAAAVSDFRPATANPSKLRRGPTLTLKLVGTSDIAAEAARANPDAVHVGFALESEDLVDRARQKMLRKGQDMVVANSVSASRSPFGADTNTVVILTRDSMQHVDEAPKRGVASIVWDAILPLLQAKRPRSTA
jgi:phosphopantothenoylcysteine decarboxylase/phosphopantothenate--cysteine ligase